MSLPRWYAAAHARNLSAAALRLTYRIQGHGMHHLGTSGPLVVVCSSESVLAGALLQALAPRPLHVLPNAAMSRLLSPGVLAATGSIPVEVPTAIDAQRAALAALADGRAVAVVGAAVPASWLLAASGAPMAAVTLLGESGRVPADPARPGARIRAYGSEQVVLDIPGDPLRASVRAAIDERMRQILDDAHEVAERRAGLREAS